MSVKNEINVKLDKNKQMEIPDGEVCVCVCVGGGGRATPTVDSIVSLVAVCQSSTVENPCIENHGCYINIMKLITELKVISI